MGFRYAKVQICCNTDTLIRKKFVRNVIMYAQNIF